MSEKFTFIDAEKAQYPIVWHMSAWSCRVDQQRGETLHPPKDRDVINGDVTLGQQFLDVSV